MAPQNNAGLIRLGILALPLGALCGFVGNLSGLSTPDPGDDPAGAAQAASTTGYFLTQFIGNVLGPTFAIFGIIALFAYLVGTRVGRLASLAMVISILGFALLLSFLGVITYAIPALSQEYLNGQQTALQMTDALFSGRLFTIVIVSGLLQFVGFVLFGIAIWRSEMLPKWAGVLLAISGLLLGFPANVPFLSLLGTAVAVIGGGWIALSVFGRLPERAEGAEGQSRVR
jgi:hypothetical protein